MDSRYRFLTLGTPWTQSMPSRDVNAVTRLAEASWRRDKKCYHFGMAIVRVFIRIISIPDEELFSETAVRYTA